jgi:outer membrane lipoprotein-sorting protein
LGSGTASDSERNGSDTLVKKVRFALNRIKPFQIQFVQQVYVDEQYDSDIADIEESGEILFKNHQHLKWTYLKPDFKVFLLQQDDYKFYDEENEQLTIGKIKDRSQQWIWQLFFSDDVLQYTYEQVNGAHKKIYIKREDAEQPLDIEIRLNKDFLPVQVIQEDPNSGVRMIFYFKDYKEKIKIPKDAFELNVPEDVEIIEGEIGRAGE